MFLFLTFIAIISILAFSIYNGLIRRRNEVDNAFGGISVQLKKRYDLIPNIVSSVKEYVKHEQEILNNLTKLRASALNPNISSSDQVDLDNKISSGIRKVMISVENYPDLKANENFIHLQKSLNEVESQISAARRAFNATVTNYNNGIQVFPNSIIANMMKMAKKEVFTIPNEQKVNVDISKMF